MTTNTHVRVTTHTHIHEQNPQRWLLFPRPNAGATLRLFCFHYAGGSALTFRPWPERLPGGVEVCAVQTPGRGERWRERPHDSLLDLIRDMLPHIVPHLDKPFAFFGHSMGAMIGFELARHLRRECGLQPAHLFVSGRRAPPLVETERVTYNLPEPEFLESLRDLNGTPREVLEHEELMQLMSPLLRADFAVCQTYKYTPEPPLDCPLTAFGGLADPEVSREQLGAWREETASRFTMRMFPGDHFFLNTATPLVLEALSQELAHLVRTLRGAGA